MKKNTIAAFAVTGLFALTAFTITDNIITRLGMRQAEAKEYIFGNMVGDFVYLPNGENWKASHGDAFKIPTVKLLPDIIKGDKAGAAKELCTYVKMYCNSEDFINDYNRHRNMFKPANEIAPTPEVKVANQNLINMYKESIASYEKYLADAKKKKDANSIALYEKSLADLRKQVAALEDPTPKKTAWEKKYPVNPAPFIKTRLEEYLSLVATVDFSAKLTSKGDKMIFVNPDYEKKSKKWKAIYRAGKEVNDAVTAFVKDWLKGEIIADVKTKMPDDADESSEKKTQAAKPSNETQKTGSIIDSTMKKRRIGSGLRNKVNGVLGKNL